MEELELARGNRTAGAGGLTYIGTTVAGDVHVDVPISAIARFYGPGANEIGISLGFSKRYTSQNDDQIVGSAALLGYAP